MLNTANKHSMSCKLRNRDFIAQTEHPAQYMLNKDKFMQIQTAGVRFNNIA